MRYEELGRTESFGTVHFSPDTAAALTAIAQGASVDVVGDERDLVFATGKPNSERNVLRSLTRLVKRAEPNLHVAPHDFRRMTASILVSSGVDISTAAAILGHKRASVLLDVYAKALRAPKRAAVGRLQATLDAVTVPALPAPKARKAS